MRILYASERPVSGIGGEAARAHARSEDYSAAVNVERFLSACHAAQNVATRTLA